MIVIVCVVLLSLLMITHALRLYNYTVRYDGMYQPVSALVEVTVAINTRCLELIDRQCRTLLEVLEYMAILASAPVTPAADESTDERTEEVAEEPVVPEETTIGWYEWWWGSRTEPQKQD